jgi:hypothetical protein
LDACVRGGGGGGGGGVGVVSVLVVANVFSLLVQGEALVVVLL